MSSSRPELSETSLATLEKSYNDLLSMPEYRRHQTQIEDDNVYSRKFVKLEEQYKSLKDAVIDVPLTPNTLEFCRIYVTATHRDEIKKHQKNSKNSLGKG